MKEARFLYKCRSCNETFEDGLCCDADYAGPHLYAADAESHVTGLSVAKTTAHDCYRNRVGLADLIGYHIVGTE